MGAYKKADFDSKFSLKSLFSSLRFRLLAVVVLGVIPALGLILYTTADQRRFATEDVQNGALRMARLVASDQERLVDETRQLLVTLSYLPEASTGRQPGCNQVFAELLGEYPQYANLGVLSLEGSLLCNGFLPGAEVNLAHLPAFQRSLSEGAFVAGNFQIDPLTGRPTIYFAYPVFDENDIINTVIIAALNLEWLNQMVTTVQLPEDAILMVIDRKRTVLFYYPDPDQTLVVGSQAPDSPLVSAMLEQGEGAAELAGVDGVERLYGFAQLSNASQTGIFVSIGVSKDAAFSRVDQILYRHLAGLSIVVTLALAAAWFGGDLFILRRVKALVNATRRLASGDLSARTGLSYGHGELSQLAQVFDQMGEALEQREVERLDTENQIKRHMRDLAALNTITATVSSSLDLTEVLESLKRLLAEEFGVPGGVIFFYEESDNTLYLEAAWGLPSAILSELKTLPADIAGYRQVVEQREALFAENFQSIEPYAASDLSSIRPNLHSYLCIPLLAKGQVQGVIDLFSKAPASFSEDQVNVFKTLGQEVGVAIQNARFFEQVKSGRERLRFLSKQLIEVQENERRHIARELHDEIGQALTAVKVNLQSMLRAEVPGVSIPRLEESIGIIDRSIHQVRNLSLDLRPSLLDDLGIISALRWYIDRQAQRAGFEAQFISVLPEVRLPPEVETTCFRIVQEALTNVIRHAKASQVTIVLSQVGEDLEVVIRDDGIGFDIAHIREQPPEDATLGLLGMKERVELVGGTLEIQSGLRAGTEIRACLPLYESQPQPGSETLLDKGH
jgi:signal transduction histidine kinase/HAMP domain-containing protein